MITTMIAMTKACSSYPREQWTWNIVNESLKHDNFSISMTWKFSQFCQLFYTRVARESVTSDLSVDSRYEKHWFKSYIDHAGFIFSWIFSGRRQPLAVHCSTSKILLTVPIHFPLSFSFRFFYSFFNNRNVRFPFSELCFHSFVTL